MNSWLGEAELRAPFVSIQLDSEGPEERLETPVARSARQMHSRRQLPRRYRGIGGSNCELNKADSEVSMQTALRAGSDVSSSVFGAILNFGEVTTLREWLH